MTRSRALAAALLCLVVGCKAPTELLLIVKAAPGLTFGRGADIDALHVQVQPADESPLDFYYTRSVELCPKEKEGSADCRPQPYADPDYPGALTLPVRFLLEPGDSGLDKEIRIWVDALKEGYGQPRLANGMRFKFSRGHRLWLELPLYHQCLDNLACQAQDQVCDKNKDCSMIDPSTSEPPPDTGGDTDLGTSPDAAFDLAVPVITFECGALMQPCCTTGSQCTVANSACENGYCADTTVLCGQLGQACCTSGNVCLGAGVCNPGTGNCDPPCGANGQLCCTSAKPCLTGGCFMNDPAPGMDTCLACGGTGDLCCPTGTACGGRNNCTANMCTACGAAGQPPCAAGAACDGTLAVDGNGRCNACGGGANAGCCAVGAGAPTCNTPSTLTCDVNVPIVYPAPKDLCVPCGMSGQACCKDQGATLPCTGSLVCGSDQKCALAACGTAGIQCCGGVGGTCPGLYCNPSGVCEICGVSGTHCCPTGDMGCTCGGSLQSAQVPSPLHGETWSTFSVKPVSPIGATNLCL